MNNGPVFIIDDDNDDQELVEQVWKDLALTNPLLFFDMGDKVLDHLKQDDTAPFLIICDVNLPKMDGFELRQNLLDIPSMNYRTIPFIFWSSEASTTQIKKAYDVGGHGFFIKESRYEALKQQFTDIIHYWQKSQSPE